MDPNKKMLRVLCGQQHTSAQSHVALGPLSDGAFRGIAFFYDRATPIGTQPSTLEVSCDCSFARLLRHSVRPHDARGPRNGDGDHEVADLLGSFM